MLADESRDLSQVEKKITELETEQIHKMTVIFTQNGQKLPFLVKIVVIFFNLLSSKGQLISKGLFKVFICTKK